MARRPVATGAATPAQREKINSIWHALVEQFADIVKKQYNITLRPPVATYCSWYAEGPGHDKVWPAVVVHISHEQTARVV